MEQIPMDWIDKLFDCMAEFYGQRWKFDDALRKTLNKTMWQSGLYGLSYDEIKKTLLYYKWIANHYPHEAPPHQMEFHKTAKEKFLSFVAPHKEDQVCDPSVAKAALAEIKRNLSGQKTCST